VKIGVLLDLGVKQLHVGRRRFAELQLPVVHRLGLRGRVLRRLRFVRLCLDSVDARDREGDNDA